MPKKSAFVLASLAALLLSGFASASTITGTVKNGTTGKPSAGDEVILIKLAQAMDQVAHTRSGADGSFTLPVEDDSIPHLVRVIHDKALYHQPAPPGATHVDVEVFDAAPRLAGITGNVALMRVQTDQSGLAVTELYAVDNNSKPPRTLLSNRTFEIFLPPDAAIDSGMAAGPGGMPLRSAPVPLAEKGHYAFLFPLRPGETQFQLSYHLPYSGQANFAPRLSLPVKTMAVMLPDSMQFSAADAGSFEQAQEKKVLIEVAHNLAAGPTSAFRVSGTGTIPEDALNAAGGGDSATAAQNATDGHRPGGGIGVPESTPDPLENYRWYVLGAIIVVLAAGAFWLTSRQPAPAAVAGGASGAAVLPAATAFPAPRPAPPATPAASRSAMLMEVLKEELFQLETERVQGKISAEEYEKAKAALHQTLGRAIRRQSQPG